MIREVARLVVMLGLAAGSFGCAMCDRSMDDAPSYHGGAVHAGYSQPAIAGPYAGEQWTPQGEAIEYYDGSYYP